MPEKQFRDFVVMKESTDDGGEAIAAISTSTVDRDKEVLNPAGADFTNYLRNPTVLWAHDYSGTPVGKALWVKSGIKYVKAKWRWAKTEKAREIKQLWEGGFLNAVSVGFIPTESHEPLPAEIRTRPELADARRIIDKWELLEFSIVPVPANPDALAAAVDNLHISTATQKELGLVEGTSRGPVKRLEPVKIKRLPSPVQTARMVIAKLRGKIYL